MRPPCSFPASDAYPTQPATPFTGGVEGAYLQRLGVCAFDVDIQHVVVDALTQQLPGKVDSMIGGLPLGLPFSANTSVEVASFVDQTGPAAPEAGVDMLMSIYTRGSVPVYGSFETFNSFNYTFTFTLHDGQPQDDGVLSVSVPSEPAPNPKIWKTFNGTLGPPFPSDPSASLESQLESSLPPAIEGTLTMMALNGNGTPTLPVGQAVPYPPGSPLKCCPAPGQTPPPGCGPCYNPCHSVTGAPLPDGGLELPDGGSPNTASASDPNDLSWYNVGYCGYTVGELNAAVDTGLQAYGFPPSTQSPQIAQIYKNMEQALTGEDITRTYYNNIRCNFFPSYASTPTCEFVVRAKRLNVFPDALELVWFDGLDRQHVDPTEYGPSANEAFSVYLLLLGAGADTSMLCHSQAQQAAAFGMTPVSHPFAFGNAAQ